MNICLHVSGRFRGPAKDPGMAWRGGRRSGRCCIGVAGGAIGLVLRFGGVVGSDLGKMESRQGLVAHKVAEEVGGAAGGLD